MMRYFRMIGFSLATMGAIFFAGTVYSAENGAIVGQPQLDTPTTAGQASVSNTALVANMPASPSAQLNAINPGVTKQMPATKNVQNIERDFFRGSEGVSK